MADAVPLVCSRDGGDGGGVGGDGDDQSSNFCSCGSPVGQPDSRRNSFWSGRTATATLGRFLCADEGKTAADSGRILHSTVLASSYRSSAPIPSPANDT